MMAAEAGEVLTAAVLGGAAALAVAVGRHVSPRGEAEHFYYSRDVRLYYLLQAAYALLFLAAAVNGRYLAGAALTGATRALAHVGRRRAR